MIKSERNDFDIGKICGSGVDVYEYPTTHFPHIPVRAGCYFPVEFQGEFLTQSMTSREIAYNSVSILFDSVPGWGACHRRLGRHVILSNGKFN